jgi:hypothetical protein
MQYLHLGLPLELSIILTATKKATFLCKLTSFQEFLFQNYVFRRNRFSSLK